MKTYTSQTNLQTEKKLYIDCPICGQASFYFYWGMESCIYVRCQNCGLVYQNPQPSFDDLRKRYDKNYFQYEIENEENFFRLMSLGLKDIGFDKNFFLNCKKKTFLDIGCATGKLLAEMANLGFTVQGVEICEESALYGLTERQIPMFIGPLEQANFPAQFFSFIHFSHLIEHVPDPSLFLNEVKRILDPEGYVIITTPNIASLQARLFKSAWRSAIPDHLFLFSRKTLSALLLKTGFKIERLITWGGIAKGLSPLWLKNPVDYLAKKLGFGDVMLILARLQSA